MQNFFSVLGLAEVFGVDSGSLEKGYFDAQRRFHPDRLVGKSPAERQQAISQSMLVNEAYETLKDPLKRAWHLLALKGITQSSLKPSNRLLTEMMEIREELSEASDAQAIARIEKRNEEMREDMVAALANAFVNEAYAEAGELAMRLGYIIKIGEEIRLRKQVISGIK